jgi:hypothetical protein
VLRFRLQKDYFGTITSGVNSGEGYAEKKDWGGIKDPHQRDYQGAGSIFKHNPDLWQKYHKSGRSSFP